MKGFQGVYLCIEGKSNNPPPGARLSLTCSAGSEAADGVVEGGGSTGLLGGLGLPGARGEGDAGMLM